ncbi:MAG TPA: hypothetical protein VFM88_21430 [Vicinamibacteria bacterium]|nr:hypothetical protein [Vicinamibacteria bacterium]
MRGTRILLLLSLLGLGSSVETAYRLREQLGVGPFGWRVLGGKFYGPSFDFDEKAERALAPGVAVEIENAFGDVEVAAGGPGKVEIALRKVVYLGSEARARAFAQRIRLEAEVSEGRLRIRTNRAELEREGDAFAIGFETHVTIRVPPDTAVALKGSHGRASVEGAGQTRIENQFGDVRARRVGPLTVDSGHGDVDVEGVTGELVAQVRFGETVARDVSAAARLVSEHGHVTTERTGALDLQVQHGGLKADTVNGDLDVRGEHSGIEARQVHGAARITTSFEDVTLEDVAADARVRVEHGHAKCARIKGALVAESTFGDAELEDVEGAVEATVSHGGVQGARLLGGVKAKAEGDDIVLDSFRGEVTAEAERGSVRLSPDGALTANLKASARFGSVSLGVPEGSRFAMVAGVERGDLRVSLPGLQLSESSTDRLRGRLGEGGGTVELQADHGDVRVSRPGSLDDE